MFTIWYGIKNFWGTYGITDCAFVAIHYIIPDVFSIFLANIGGEPHNRDKKHTTKGYQHIPKMKQKLTLSPQWDQQPFFII
jgi:hypothetical protein